MSLRHYLQHSSDPLASFVRALRRGLRNFSVPTIPFVTRAILLTFLFIRSIVHTLRRVFWAEPMFKAYCTQYGKNLHTGIFLHWVIGSGKIVIGDNTSIDGKCSLAFSTAYRPDPTLKIGSNVWIGHGCGFTVADEIEIGDHVMIAGLCAVLDTGGHPTDPDLRRAKMPAPRDRVKPVRIGDDAWIGQSSILLPGTIIGKGAVVSAHSVVRGHVEDYTIVAGNPAKVVGHVKRSAAPPPESE